MPQKTCYSTGGKKDGSGKQPAVALQPTQLTLSQKIYNSAVQFNNVNQMQKVHIKCLKKLEKITHGYLKCEILFGLW